ncbi:MAG TPA: adenosylcobinamide amidohydrolase [Methanocorpusculum sp.]|nr:adenosylcobinamide amidohydrolase [Methanocorpusculum sp.]
MRYHYDKDTVYIRGTFRAASTGIDGGLKNISTILNHTVPKKLNYRNQLEIIKKILAHKGYGSDAFGLLTTVKMQNLCILQYDFITVFVTANISNPDPAKPHNINIIVTSDESMSDASILETIMVATEAKSQALRNLGKNITGTTSDKVVVAAAPDIHPKHIYADAGTLTEIGHRVYDAVLAGVIASIKRHEECVQRTIPSYFIFSRYGGGHWIEWQKQNCLYYPCHFKGQACDFCYCPFYPCHDKELGEFVDSSAGSKIWACTNCLLLHNPEIATYLKKHADATLNELKTKQK